MIATVIKVGGSLGQSPALPNLMQIISKLGNRHKILIVPGGGAFANAIRDYDQRFGVAQDTGHWMSILAMDQYGHLLASMIADSTLVHGLAAARETLSSGRIPILLTYNLLRQTDALPKSWDITSDSIAVWLADLAGARQVVLLKSVDGLFSDTHGTNGGGELLETASPSQVQGYGGVVDRSFASIFKKTTLAAWLVNGKHPERLDQLLNTGTTKGTRLLR